MGSDRNNSVWWWHEVSEKQTGCERPWTWGRHRTHQSQAT